MQSGMLVEKTAAQNLWTMVGGLHDPIPNRQTQHHLIGGGPARESIEDGRLGLIDVEVLDLPPDLAGVAAHDAAVDVDLERLLATGATANLGARCMNVRQARLSYRRHRREETRGH